MQHIDLHEAKLHFVDLIDVALGGADVLDLPHEHALYRPEPGAWEIDQKTRRRL